MAEQKKYSHVVAIKKSEKDAFLHIEGFIGRDAELNERTVNGEQRFVANTAIASNNVMKPINYALGEKLDLEDSTFIELAVWGRDAERFAKVAKKGNGLAVTGTVYVHEHEGKKRLRMNVDGFKVFYFKPGNNDNAEQPKADAQPVAAGAKDDLPF